MPRTWALALLVGVVIVTAWRWGSFVAGGSDSACYATQAVLWSVFLGHPRSGSLQPPEVLAHSAPWPAATATFTPTGHVPSTVVAGAFVPICPAGLSLLMAPLYLAGGASLMFAVVPLFGVILVLATYAVGARFAPRVGVAAAALIVASPVFLYQVVQPMSDVPAAALWVLAVACATGTRPRHAMLAGLATSAAVVIRPNLVPLACAIGLFLALRPERSWAQRLRSALTYAVWAAPGCVAVALIQRSFYGSPFASGYGSYAGLFSADHVAPNLAHYAGWLLSAHTPAIVLALAAPILLPGGLSILLLSLFAINIALYLPYIVFSDWSFVRFLLPAIPLLLVLVAAVLDAVAVRLWRSGLAPAHRIHRRRAAAVLAVVVAAAAAAGVEQARTRHAFELRDMESRFARAGRFVASRLPPNALVITDYESGSVPFYSGRRTMTWAALDPAWLDRAVTFVRNAGFEPYLLFERWEEPQFRSRFGQEGLGALDWPPMAEVATQVRIYRIADRDRYRQGLSISTENAP
jgi:hypothetical protein